MDVRLRLLLATGILLGAAPLRADPVPTFTASPIDWATGVWGDGDDLLVVLGAAAIHELHRGRPEAPLVPLRGATSIAGAGTGAEAVVAVAAETRAAVRRDGRWELVGIPVLGSDVVTGVAVTPDGRVHFAGAGRALYRRDGTDWTTLPYPPGLTGVQCATASPDGTLYLAGRGGLVVEVRDDRFTMRLRDDLRDPFSMAWVSPTSGTLWLASPESAEVVAYDLRKGAVRRLRTGLFGKVHALGGVATARGDLVVVGAMEDLALLDGPRTTRLAPGVVFPTGLFVDVRAGRLLVVNRDGLTWRELQHPALAALAARLPAPRAAAPDAAPPPAETPPAGVALPVEARAEPEDAPPDADPSGDATSGGEEEPLRMPTLRLGFGAGFFPHGDGAVTEDFALDLNLGARLGLTGGTFQVSVWPELGYTYERSAAFGGHTATAGLGLLVGSPLVAVGWTPRFVVGARDGRFALGVRNSLVVPVLYGILSAEVGHEWLSHGGHGQHEVRVLFAVDVVPILAYLAFLPILDLFDGD